MPGLDPEWDKRWLERCKVPPRIHGSLAAIALHVGGGAGHRAWPSRRRARPTGRAIRAALEEVDVKDSPLGPIKFDDEPPGLDQHDPDRDADGKLRILEKLRRARRY